MAIVTYETKAWLTEYDSVTPAQLLTPEGASNLTYSDHDMTTSGWSLAGTATITVVIHDLQTLVDNKVAALREQAKGIRATATAKCTQIEGQIQQLLCIENNPSLAATREATDEEWDVTY